VFYFAKSTFKIRRNCTYGSHVTCISKQNFEIKTSSVKKPKDEMRIALTSCVFSHSACVHAGVDLSHLMTRYAPITGVYPYWCLI